MTIDELICVQVVDLVTEYLEGALPAEDRTRFEEHVVLCAGCGAYVEQMRETIRVTGALTPESVDREAVQALARVFKEWLAE